MFVYFLYSDLGCKCHILIMHRLKGSLILQFLLFYFGMKHLSEQTHEIKTTVRKFWGGVFIAVICVFSQFCGHQSLFSKSTLGQSWSEKQQ